MKPNQPNWRKLAETYFPTLSANIACGGWRKPYVVGSATAATGADEYSQNFRTVSASQ